MFPDKLADTPLCERIFCNRSLNMKSIRAVGFDMDYTLALYKQETFEKLAYEETLKKLVTKGYPEEILNWQFDHTYMIRGLVIDKIRGNILKIDRHRYVKVAYHGFKELSRDERRKLYDVENVIVYEEPDFALLDTLFSLAEAFLFAQLVEYKEKKTKLHNKSFFDFYTDIRAAIDLCHRDGSIKEKVAQNPEKYIAQDKFLTPILEEIKAFGRKTFIVTNSLWDYTHIVMNYLCGNQSRTLNYDWLSYFDVVITGSSKPHFFTSQTPLQDIDFKDADQTQTKKVFHGGHFKTLHNLLDINKGSEILYIGDHIYGDILRSKKTIGWRTMLVIEELEKEINVSTALKEQYTLCDFLNMKKIRLEDELERLKVAVYERDLGKEILSVHLKDYTEKELNQKIAKLEYDISCLRETEKKELRNYHLTFHPVWGELMKTGRQNSRFAAQVENYACLYTSKLTNLRHYGFHKSYRAVRDFMPHDLEE